MPKLHAFTALGANQEESEEMRLPSPEQPLLTRLTEPQLAELIERYIDYIEDVDDGAVRSVHLHGTFVHHYYTRPDDVALPLASAVVTLPLVLGDGTLLKGRGLDRDRGIVFRIPEELGKILPDKADCTPSAVAEAMRFLTDEWLCDVAADYAGKCTIIASALSVIERSLLPDRPVFWITAGRRGGGKTTSDRRDTGPRRARHRPGPSSARRGVLRRPPVACRQPRSRRACRLPSAQCRAAAPPSCCRAALGAAADRGLPGRAAPRRAGLRVAQARNRPETA